MLAPETLLYNIDIVNRILFSKVKYIYLEVIEKEKEFQTCVSSFVIIFVIFYRILH